MSMSIKIVPGILMKCVPPKSKIFGSTALLVDIEVRIDRGYSGSTQ